MYCPVSHVLFVDLGYEKNAFLYQGDLRELRIIPPSVMFSRGITKYWYR